MRQDVRRRYNHPSIISWRFDTGGTVLASPVVASLRKGERPSVVFNSDGALYILGHDGRLRWKHDGIRHFDRSVKSPSLGDLDGDGNLEILVASDTGEVLALDSARRVLWRHTTAGQHTAALSLTVIRGNFFVTYSKPLACR